jgi:ACS family allantoate permease-like MFS transporter
MAEAKSATKDDIQVGASLNADVLSIRIGKAETPDFEEPATAYLQEHEHEWSNYEPHEARRVLRKIDWRLMPLIIGSITIAAVDVGYPWAPSLKENKFLTWTQKILISNAALYGMSKDVHLKGQQYSWGKHSH